MQASPFRFAFGGLQASQRLPTAYSGRRFLFILLVIFLLVFVVGPWVGHVALA